jgi:phosphoribosyl-ATP pyrophosphohydrolase/phosphoribosyl-AMP cyclohydrolase
VIATKARRETGGLFVFGHTGTGDIERAERVMDFSKLGGLIPAVVQDEDSNEVLMVGFMNEEAWQRTRASGYVTFFSRTRQKLWMKGETSGNRLLVRQVMLDCDDDTVLFKVRREGEGNVCHLNRVSCFCTYVENAEVGERR